MEDLIQQIGTVIAVLTSVVTLAYLIIKNRAEVKKLNFEGQSSLAGATDEVAEAAQNLIGPLNDRIISLTEEIEALKLENDEQDRAVQSRMEEREEVVRRLSRLIRDCNQARIDQIKMTKHVAGLLSKSAKAMENCASPDDVEFALKIANGEH